MDGYGSKVSNAEAIMVEYGIEEQCKRSRHTAIGKRCSQSQRVLHMLVMIFFHNHRQGKIRNTEANQWKHLLVN